MMTESEIQDNNEKIAKFMGLRTFRKRYPRNHGIGGSVDRPESCIVEKLKYHKSWDDLMRVIGLIEAIGFRSRIELFTEKEHRVYFVASTESGHFFDESLPGGERDANKLKATYMSVVQFIKWYNENYQEKK